MVRVRHVVDADETRLRLVRDKSGKTKNGFVWTFGARDDEGELDVAHVFAEDRSGATPKTLLEGTTGVLLRRWLQRLKRGRRVDAKARPATPTCAAT